MSRSKSFQVYVSDEFNPHVRVGAYASIHALREQVHVALCRKAIALNGEVVR